MQHIFHINKHSQIHILNVQEGNKIAKIIFYRIKLIAKITHYMDII